MLFQNGTHCFLKYHQKKRLKYCEGFNSKFLDCKVLVILKKKNTKKTIINQIPYFQTF